MSAGLNIILVGGGGHGAVVAEAVLAMGACRICGVVDDQPTPLAHQLGHLGGLNELGRVLREHSARWVLTVGDVRTRGRLLNVISDEIESLGAGPIVHSGAVVSPSASLGRGVFIGAGAVIQARAKVHPHAIINTGAIVEHDCLIGENTHIAPGAVLGGNVSVGRDTLIGLGARVKPGVSIGAGVTVGVGAAVIQGVRRGQTVVGVPARALGAGVAR